MSSQQAVMTAPLSRPKVHRLPAAPSRISAPSLSLPAVFAMLMVTGVAFGLNHFKHKTTPILADMPEMAPVTANLVTPAPAGGGTIVIKDDKQAIVGQMAKIPSQNQQITEIKSVSNVDNNIGRELLSIVGKY